MPKQRVKSGIAHRQSFPRDELQAAALAVAEQLASARCGAYALAKASTHVGARPPWRMRCPHALDHDVRNQWKDESDAAPIWNSCSSRRPDPPQPLGALQSHPRRPQNRLMLHSVWAWGAMPATTQVPFLPVMVRAPSRGPRNDARDQDHRIGRAAARRVAFAHGRPDNASSSEPGTEWRGLATVRPEAGRTLRFPCCFAIDGETVYSVVDAKPRHRSLCAASRNTVDPLSSCPVDRLLHGGLDGPVVDSARWNRVGGGVGRGRDHALRASPRKVRPVRARTTTRSGDLDHRQRVARVAIVPGRRASGIDGCRPADLWIFATSVVKTMRT